MSWYPTSYAVVALLGAAVPAIVGFYAWQRRDKPGAGTLAFLMWLLALWGLLYAVQLGGRNDAVVILFHEAKTAVLAFAPPLWLIFVLRYTGRDRWTSSISVALLTAVPVATLALIPTNQDHGLVWSSQGVRDVDSILAPGFVRGLWFWMDFAYGTALILAGTALLVLMLFNSQRLYAKQSACLLLGFVGPWVAHAAHVLGLDNASWPGLDLMVLAFAPAGLVLVLGLYRYRLLDISPIAHDTVVEVMSDGTLVLDTRNRIVDLNPSAARILGCKPGEVIGRAFREVMGGRGNLAPLKGDRGISLVRRYEEQGQAHEEIQLGEGKEARHYDLALSALYNSRGQRSGHLVVLHEITERKIAVERLDRMARYDTLTGLPNRAFFHERLNQEVARVNRAASVGLLALMFLDLDRFKLVNDTLGHEIGDLLLKETARRLKASVREYDIVSRLAGDEFTVILPEISNVRDAIEVANRIIETISKPFVLDGNELTITTSVGICLCPTDSKDPSTLVKNADAAMYRAKAAGKGRCEVFSSKAFREGGDYLGMEDELNRAVEENEFVLHYQPKIEIPTSRTVGVEALLRWEHPERGLVYPLDFISSAEASGLVFVIERWILREACRQMRSWHERYPTDKPLTVSVNISSRHFAHPNLAGVVHNVLEETGLPSESLLLEFKESILHKDPASAAVTLKALKNLGVKLAVDNFGAGYSSLQNLRQFPLDVLKIDTSFVRALDDREEDYEVVSAIISLAHALGLKSTAQGVETPRQLVQLKDMGCDIAQGFYFAGSLSHRATAAFIVADLYY